VLISPHNFVNFFILLQICRRLWQYSVPPIILMLVLMTDWLYLFVMLTVIHRQPIDGWTSILWKLQIDISTLCLHRENTDYSVQQAMPSVLLTAVSYRTVCLHDTFSTVRPSVGLSITNASLTVNFSSCLFSLHFVFHQRSSIRIIRIQFFYVCAYYVKMQTLHQSRDSTATI